MKRMILACVGVVGLMAPAMAADARPPDAAAQRQLQLDRGQR